MTSDRKSYTCLQTWREAPWVIHSEEVEHASVLVDPVDHGVEGVLEGCQVRLFVDRVHAMLMCPNGTGPSNSTELTCSARVSTLRRHLRHGGGWGWPSMALPRRSRSQAGHRGRFFGHCWKPLLILVNFRRQSSPGFFVFCLMTTFWLTATFWLLCVRTGALSPGPCCSKSDCPTLSLSLSTAFHRDPRVRI